MINTEATHAVQKIRIGLKKDINKIIEDFQRLDSVRFVDFSRVWREHRFSFIFTYKLNENDLREFIEEAYHIVLEQLSRCVKPERAISILYLVYCLYVCQPIQPKIPIKLNLPKHKAFRSLFQESCAHKHLDACYIWMKLLSFGAFHMVAQTKTYGPLTMKKEPIPSSSSSSNNLTLDYLQEIETEMDNLQYLHNSYTALKDSLEGPDSEQIRDMTLVRDDLFKEFKNILDKSADELDSNQQDENS